VTHCDAATGTHASSCTAPRRCRYLGYSTDNGAYYYYHTEPGLSYQDTLSAVRADADAKGLPFR